MLLDAVEARKAARSRRLRIAWTGLLAAAAVAGAVLLIVVMASGEDGDSTDASQVAASDVRLPVQQIGDLEPAAKAAGCRLQSPPIGEAAHDDKEFTAADYETNPPASGAHNPDWYQDGIYEPGATPRLGMLVHTLEHGRINVQYRRGTPAATVAQLEALLAEQNGGYHMLLFENATDMDYAVAATAWGQVLACEQMNDQVFDALRTFTARYVDKGPEAVP